MSRSGNPFLAFATVILAAAILVSGKAQFSSIGKLPTGLEGQVLGSVSITPWSTNTITFFARGTDGSMYQRNYNPSTNEWTAWAQGSHGGTILASPSCISLPPVAANSNIDCFVIDVRNEIGMKSLTGGATGSWSAWGNIPENRQSSAGVNCVSAAVNSKDCFIRGLDGSIYRKNFFNRVWNPWKKVPSLLGVLAHKIGAVAEPTCVSPAPNKILCVVRGVDSIVYHNSFVADSLTMTSPWVSLQGTASDNPSLITYADNQAEVIIRNEKGEMVKKAWLNGNWASTWTPVANFIGYNQIVGSRRTDVSNAVDYLTVGADGLIHHWTAALSPGDI